MLEQASQGARASVVEGGQARSDQPRRSISRRPPLKRPRTYLESVMMFRLWPRQARRAIMTATTSAMLLDEIMLSAIRVYSDAPDSETTLSQPRTYQYHSLGRSRLSRP